MNAVASRLCRTVVVCAVLLTGCATSGPGRVAHDPIEPVNRAVFAFNEKADAWVMKPIAQVYANYVPDVVQLILGSMLSNVGDLWIAANQLMQGKPVEAIHDLSRFTLNTTLGLVGMADVASAMGLEKHQEDFGQTLGRWGVPSGPYLVLPFLGPSSVRDAFGLSADVLADPVRNTASVGQYNNYSATRLVVNRASLLPAERLVDGAALDRYSFLRDGFLQRRRNLVFDGNPPPPKDD